MDFEEKNRRQFIRVLIAEVGMVIAVIAIVVVSTFAAMGFMISGDGGIEQSGLVQLHSLPTGASVRIDGNTLFPRTNLSRTLTAGTHMLEIYRDGYDTWQNEVKVHAGMLLRLYYPRLFLQNRTAQDVKDLVVAGSFEFYVPSSSRNYILYAEKGASAWSLIDVRSDEIKTTTLDVSRVLPGMKEDETVARKTDDGDAAEYKFYGVIEKIIWSRNEERVLTKVKYDNKTEWILVNLKDVAKSVNITKTFGLSEDVSLEMMDASASRMLILERKQLRKIETDNGVMSRILIDNVVNFAVNGNNIIYVTEDSEHVRRIGVYRDGEKDGTVIAEVPQGVRVKIALSEYYDEDYIAYVYDDRMTVLYGRIPNYNESGADLSELKELVRDLQLKNIPEQFAVSPEGEYLVASREAELSVVDVDMGDLYEYVAPTSYWRWFDASMMYAIKDSQLMVWDFDNANMRNLAESARNSAGDAVKALDYPVMVTADNRWIYYLTQGEKFVTLTRERIRD